jgi:hypothetical protein
MSHKNIKKVQQDSVVALLNVFKRDQKILEDKMTFIITKIIQYLGDKGIVNSEELVNYINEELEKSYELAGDVQCNEYNLEYK